MEHLRTERLLARERKQLPDESGGAVRVLLDVHDVLERWVRRTVVLQKEVGEADDRRQHVVEVMCDAAGQLPDRLHLLTLRDLHLERALLGRLDHIGDDAFALALRTFNGAQIDAAASRLVGGEGDVHRINERLTGKRQRKRLAQNGMVLLLH